MDEALRRVLLAMCEVHDELTFYEGQAFDGVGVEAEFDGAHEEGELRLWRYSQGRRVGPFVEPFFTRDQAVIVDRRHISETQKGPELIFPSGGLFTGLLAELRDGHLVSLVEEIDGNATGHSASWHRDGTIASISTGSRMRIGSALLQVWQHEQRHDRSLRNTIWSARIHMALGPDANPSVSPPDLAHFSFRTFGREDPRWFAASCGVEFDSDQRIQRFDLTGSDFFGFLAQHPLDPRPFQWLPSSLAELTTFGLSPQLKLTVDSAALAQVVAAFAPESFVPVRDLDVSNYMLGPEELFRLLDLIPRLRQVTVHGSVKPDKQRSIRGICRELKTRRSNVKIILNTKEIYPNG